MVDGPGGASAAAHAGYPTSIAAAGDSLNTGFASAGPGDHEENSWSAGANPAVQSHFARILAGIRGRTARSVIVARDGARISGLRAQMQQVVARGEIDYVTVQIGVNDICGAADESGVTPAASFRTSLAQALDVLVRGEPDARILVTSLADEARWNDAVLQLPKLAPAVRDGTICDPRPGPDGRQSATVKARIWRLERVYNGILSSVCQAYVHCLYDGGALFRLAYSPADVSPSDAFHPSVTGLAHMAAVTWHASFDFEDDVPPRARAQVTRAPGTTTIVLRGSDNASVRGLEYRIRQGSYTRYIGPLRLPPGTSVTYRAVDINGNTSATHTLVA